MVSTFIQADQPNALHYNCDSLLVLTCPYDFWSRHLVANSAGRCDAPINHAMTTLASSAVVNIGAQAMSRAGQAVETMRRDSSDKQLRRVFAMHVTKNRREAVLWCDRQQAFSICNENKVGDSSGPLAGILEPADRGRAVAFLRRVAVVFRASQKGLEVRLGARDWFGSWSIALLALVGAAVKGVSCRECSQQYKCLWKSLADRLASDLTVDGSKLC